MTIGLSTASVYPESTAHAFGYAAPLGYDAVEVMVGIDALSQQTSAVKQLAEHHGVPVCAIHAPCLLFTQRVWGTEPWGKLERSAEMAAAVGAEVVVVHPPFRWQREYARDFVDGIAALEESTGIAFAVENMYPWRASSRRGMEMYLPGWDPSGEPYANTDIDLSHAAIAQSDPDRDGRSGSGTGCGTSTSPTAPARPRTSTWCPAAGHGGRRRSCGTWPATGFDGEIVVEINTRKCGTREEREADLRESLEFAREHFAVTAAVSTTARRGRRPGAPDTRAAILAAAASCSPPTASPVRRSARSPPRPASTPRSCTTTSAPRTTCSSRRWSCRSTRARCWRRRSPAGPDGAAERMLRRLPVGLGRPRAPPALLAVVRGMLEPDGHKLLREGFLPAVLAPIGVALGHRPAERRMPLVASQVSG